ncbi:MAG: LutB/LldF family L-lactate oxidation iron-sulfur protein, partial [Acidimicrobiia bacterium]|nr:LutB/LldF family L-lactate oxidation iron-sulfur protein [Acidimicrobiia bacterium]
PAMDVMRDRARAIRMHTLARLDTYLGQLADSVERNGGKVFFAADGDVANAYIRRLAQDRESQTIVKSKSMVTEEIELNHALELDGRRVVETDLGEFIIQLARDKPSHIIAPVLHKTRFEIGELFATEIDAPYTDDPFELNAIARRYLREIFLSADMGISGVNFAAADTGTMVTVTNEGNARLCTTAPRIHVAVMGMERVVPTIADMQVMLEVLARSGTGQRLSVYTNFVTGPRHPDDADGPDEFHLIILDNGRSRVLSSGSAEILGCIRCGACLNVCPVYRHSGGHAYGNTYSGPVGAVLAPVLLDGGGFSDLAYASSLCGACKEACPIRIDIPQMLLGLRNEFTESGDTDFGWLGPGLSAYSRIATTPALWRAFLAAGGVFGKIKGDGGYVKRLPFHAGNWTSTRDLPAPAAQSFHSWWKEHRGA